jgi:hypothetical protein
MESCNIHLTLVNKGNGYGFEAASACIERLEASELLSFVEIIYCLSGKAVPEESIEMLAYPEKEPHWTKFYTNDLKRTLQTCLEVAAEDIVYIFDDSKPSINGFHCDYDPADWLKESNENFSSHVSGRLFALAYVGALEAWGFQVSGTNLPRIK